MSGASGAWPNYTPITHTLHHHSRSRICVSAIAATATYATAAITSFFTPQPKQENQP